MSAYVVAPSHIIALASFITRNYSVRSSQEVLVDLGLEADPDVPLRLAPMQAVIDCLYEENLRSVCRRYPNMPADELPGVIPGLRRIKARAEYHDVWTNFGAIGVLKAIHCLEYQSCEHAEWPESAACRLLKQAESSAVRLIPGYEAASRELDLRWVNDKVEEDLND